MDEMNEGGGMKEKVLQALLELFTGMQDQQQPPEPAPEAALAGMPPKPGLEEIA
jgi:hypothetical protein